MTFASSLFPLKRTYAYALALLSGVLYYLAFAGVDIWPLSFIAFTPLLLACYKQNPKQAFFLGLAAGTTMNLLGFSWLLSVMHVFGGFGVPLGVLFMVILCIYQGGRVAFMSYLGSKLTALSSHHKSHRKLSFLSEEKPYWAHLAIVFSFASSEYLYPLLFPWYYAATVHNVPLLTQSADLGGPILVGMFQLFSNLLCFEVLRNALPYFMSKEKPSTFSLPLFSKKIIVFYTGIFALNLGYGAARIVLVDREAARSEHVHAGIVQGNVPLLQQIGDIRGPEMHIPSHLPKEPLERHKALTAELKDKGADFAVWSESSVQFGASEELYKPVYKQRVTKDLGMPILFGGMVYRKPIQGDRERWFNTALSTSEKGDILSRYDKHYLLAFGEYLPFGDLFPVLYDLSPNSGKFSPGTKFEALTLPIKGIHHRIGALICYEDILPSFTNDLVRETKPELLVNMTNDAWFGDSSEPWEHLALAKFRAIEHRKYLVRSTNSGVSAIFDPVGRTIAQTSLFTAETAHADIRFMQGSTVYEWLGDSLWISISILSLGLVLILPLWAKKRLPSLPAEAHTS